MRSGRKLFALTTLLFLALFSAACSQSDPEADIAAANEEAWTALQQAKQALDGKRQELVDLNGLIAEAASAESDDSEPASGEPGADGGEGEAVAPTAEELAANLETLTGEVDDMTAAFSTQLVGFINDQSITEGQEFTDIQRQAFGMKGDEDILVAMEFIDIGGEYQRAIDILNNSLIPDPTNEALLAAKAKAEELRYMTEERFELVKKGMPKAEVRALLGIPKTTNQREFDNGVTGWFYPKEEPNTAAGVFFQGEEDELSVYKTDFNAVKAPEQG